MNPRRPALALIGGATLCLACTNAPDDAPQSEVGEWEFVGDLRLDANAEDFSVARWAFVGPQGEIVVPEPQDSRVRIYDSTGTLMVTIGRRGEGPGEFQAVVPVRSRIQQASMTHVWVTEYDPLDLASVVRYRIVGHPGLDLHRPAGGDFALVNCGGDYTPE